MSTPPCLHCLHQHSTDRRLIVTDMKVHCRQRCQTLERGSMWEPISPRCLDTKITNDSVHFILLPCHSTPAAYSNASEPPASLLSLATATCASILVSSELAIRSLPTPVHFKHGSEGLTHFGEFSLFNNFQPKNFVHREKATANWDFFMLDRWYCNWIF